MVEHVFHIEDTVSLIVMFAILAVAIFAFVNALMYSAESYVAAGKLTKPAWCGILGVGVVMQFVPGFFFIRIAFLVASLVYLADVRPALSSLRRR